MNYNVWWITGEGFDLEATFDKESFARLFADMLNSKAIEGGVRYEVTRAGETPVW